MLFKFISNVSMSIANNLNAIAGRYRARDYSVRETKNLKAVGDG